MISLAQVDNHLPGAQPCALGTFARECIHLQHKRHLSPLSLGTVAPTTLGIPCKVLLGFGWLHSRRRFLAPRGIVLLGPSLPAMERAQLWPVLGAPRSNRMLEGGGAGKTVGQARPREIARSGAGHTKCCLSCQQGSLSPGECRTLSDLSGGALSVWGWAHYRSLGTRNTRCSIIDLLPPS